MKQNLMWLGLFALLAASAVGLRRRRTGSGLPAETRRASEALNRALGDGPGIVPVTGEATPRQLSETPSPAIAHARTDDLLSPGPASDRGAP